MKSEHGFSVTRLLIWLNTDLYNTTVIVYFVARNSNKYFKNNFGPEVNLLQEARCQHVSEIH